MAKINVAMNVNIPVKSNKVKRALARKEITKILITSKETPHLCRGYFYEVAIMVIYTGLRRGEIRSLRWEDIQMNNRKIYIQAPMSKEKSYDAK